MKKQALKKKELPVAWIPFVFAVILCINTLPNKYCLDDYCVIINNDYVHAGLQGIPKILTTNYFNGFARFNDGLYRPIPMITFALEYAISGLDAGPRHFTNLLIYALTGMFLFLLLRKLFRNTSVLLPLSIALLYLAHPVHTEAVANIKGRDELLAFLFSILAAWQIIQYLDDEKIWRLTAGVGFFLLGLLSKENAITFLVIIPLTLFFFRKPSRKQYILVILPMLMVTAAWLLWRQHVIHSMSAAVDKGIFTAFNNSVLSADSPLSRIATGLYLQVFYIWKLLIPYPLIHDYSFNQIPAAPLASVRSVISIVILAAVCATAVFMYRRNKVVTYAILVFFITIAPVANIIVYIGATFAERFLYTPSFGFSVLTGVLLFGLIKKNNPGDPWTRLLAKNSAYSLILIGILVVYSVLFIQRNNDWKENLTLYTADVGHAAQSARAHYNYGSELQVAAGQVSQRETQQELLNTAKSELKTALSIYPPYLDAYNNLGTVYEQLNNLDSSNWCYHKILSIDSTYQKSYFNLGLNYFKMAKYGESVVALEKLVKYQPDNDKALYLLGNGLGNLGRLDEAIHYLERCMAVNDRYVDAAILLGKAYGLKGDPSKTVKLYLKILPYAPDNFEILYNLAFSYLLLKQYESSIPYLQKCIQIKPGDPQICKELIFCLEKSGKSQEAATYRQKFADIFHAPF